MTNLKSARFGSRMAKYTLLSSYINYRKEGSVNTKDPNRGNSEERIGAVFGPWKMVMLNWFGNHAPIRQKFDILLAAHLLLTGSTALAACYAVWYPTSFSPSAIMSVAALSILGTFLVVLTSKRLICSPYVTTVVRMEALAGGDLTSPIIFSENRDCVGRMTKAMRIFLRNAELVQASKKTQEQIVTSLGSGLAKLAANDLTTRIETPFPKEYEQLRGDFNAAMRAVDTAIGTIAQATATIHRGATEITQASDDLSLRTEQQAASLEQTAAAMSQVTDAVRQTAKEAIHASKIASAARQAAERGGEIAVRAVSSMRDIERTSSEIAEVISLIDGIAFQTNLLALNAGVEAARAGDAGRGFAVVASEVRALAQRSADAANDVKRRIEASAVQVQAGVQFVNETGDALRMIIVNVGEVTETVASIASAAEQQSGGLQQVNIAVSEMDGVTQQNAAMVEEVTASARSLDGEANHLNAEAGKFHISDLSGAIEKKPAVMAYRHATPYPDRRGLSGRASGNLALASDDWSAF